MAKIDKQMSEGAGRGLDESAGIATAQELHQATLADLTELRTQFIALLAKLDSDTGVNSTNYASTLTPDALTLTE